MEIKKYLEIEPSKINVFQKLNTDKTKDTNTSNFWEILDEAQKKVDFSDKLIIDYANGKDVPIHSIMISLEQARLSIQLISEVRNKIIESYHELTRTAG